LGELLQQAATRLDGEHALIRHLAEQIEDAEARAQDDQVLRLESDDDLIKVITIHKSKGLEYPLVFLPFIGAAMPVNGKNRSFFRYHDEQGKVCVDFDLSTEGKAREDRERLAEDLRLLYVALTRARHACWLGLPPLGKDNKNSYSCLLQHSAIGQRLGGGLPLPPETLRARLEALAANDGIAVHDLPDIHLQGITNDTAAVALQPARSLTQRLHTPWWIASYSGLLDQHAEAPLAPPNAPLPLAEDSPAEATASEAFMDEAAALLPVAPPATDTRAGLHDFPRGAQAGTFLHSLLEWAAAEGFARIASDTARRAAQVEQRCATRGWQDWSAPLTDALGHILRAPLPLPTPAGRVLSLSALSADQLQVELEFWFEAHTVSITRIDALLHRHILPGRPRPPLRAGLLNGMLKGFIDLVFMHQDRYYLADYKSNWLGENASAYTAEAMAAAILAHRYDLQYSLYTLALHRLLRARLPDYVYARDLGGVLYVFLRGIGEPGQPHTQGVHAVQPPFALIDALDRLFSAQPVTDSLHEPV
ncbi:MAG: PD-(D/E)XK nuclease family protein, partial [Gammaproteobacteria bacterium]|nr:PD-(D/E)XK nuclease family protein [Gammaproteobacteria bacterium]